MPRKRKETANGPTTEIAALGRNDDLQRYVSRLETLETEKAEIAAQIRDVLQQAEDHGLHKRALRQVVKLRLMTADQLQAHVEVAEERERMMAALGMLRDTPLGEAATFRALR
jgi:uncharacterized protein (UPF0335 family)